MKMGSIPIVGFCAYSGTGKTTLLIRLIPQLRAKGLKIGVIKHAHHNFDIDQPAKDSYQLRQAGANQMLIASHRRMALIEEFEEQHPEPTLQELLPTFNGNRLDLILVEGFKHDHFPKIELHRKAPGKPLIFPDDPNVIAIATDYNLRHPVRNLPLLDLNNTNEIATFIYTHIIQRDTAGRGHREIMRS